MYVCPVFFQVYPMHNALFMYIKKTLKKKNLYPLLLRRDFILSLNQIELKL